MPGQNRFFVFTIFLVVVLSIFHSGEADWLKCYNCNSAVSATCEHNPTSGEVVSCSQDNNVCVSYNIEYNGRKLIIRTCGYRDFCKSTNPDVIKNCRECTHDQCKGEGLKCYNCNSLISATCEHNPTSGEVVTCSLDNNICVSYNIENNGRKLTIRTCGYRDFCKYTNPDVIKNCKECTNDLCKG
ncbi:uncharacterized protein [Temnothorax longispinosus]|uniref:uncharacterized protein n=1 Tax=Temnothorax longispinosus TaxID=300112 RepID=UPI003A99670D